MLLAGAGKGKRLDDFSSALAERVGRFKGSMRWRRASSTRGRCGNKEGGSKDPPLDS